MTKEKIICLPNPHLRQRSKKVGLIDENILSIIEEMKKATLDWEDSRSHEVGVALAAVQIDQLLRIVVIRNNFDNKKDRTFQIFINPKIVKYEGELIEDFEGCLSIKNIYGKVPRYTKVKVQATDINNKSFRITASDFMARIFQHEIDHTNGKLFIDYIKGSSDSFFQLKPDGKLEPIDYENSVKNNKDLWG